MVDLSPLENELKSRAGSKVSGDEIAFRCPCHDDKTASASYNIKDHVWNCLGCDAKGNHINLAELLGIRLELPSSDNNIAAAYDYVDENKNLLYQVVKFLPKDFRYRRPNGKGWHWSIKGIRRVLYNLPSVLKAIEEKQQVFLVEGEKDANRLINEGLAATTTPMGAKAGWRDEYSDSLKGAELVIIPDNDDTGHKHAKKVSKALIGIAESTKIIYLPELPEKGDVSDWLNTGNSIRGLLHIVENTTPEVIDPTKYGYHDVGNGKMFVDMFGYKLKWNKQNSWCVHDDKHWIQDDKNQVYELTKEANMHRFKSASKIEEGDEEKKEKLIKHYIRSNNMRSIEATVKAASSDPRIACSITDFDQNDFLFNCQNGTIDLKTGELRPHDPADMISMIGNTNFDPQAKCPTWLRFQDEINTGDQELTEFKQRLFGYALTGDTREQVFSIHYGTGANGKSTEMDILLEVLGDYGKVTNFDTFASKERTSSHSEDIARLRGARVVSAMEGEQGKRLNDSLIKQLTGGDAVSARFLYGHSFTYKPNYKIFLATNHKPRVKDTSHGFWRRVNLIPYDRVFKDEEKDNTLKEKLREELEGILTWLVVGCMMWQADGLKAPKRIKDATESYKEDSDLIGEFVNNCCFVDLGNDTIRVKVGQLYLSYKEYSSQMGVTAFGKQSFNSYIESRGFEKRKSTGGDLYFFGIGLQNTI